MQGVCLCICTVEDFSAEDKTSGIKFCTVFRRRPGQGICNFGELCSPRSPKSARAWYMRAGLPWRGPRVSACVDKRPSPNSNVLVNVVCYWKRKQNLTFTLQTYCWCMCTAMILRPRILHFLSRIDREFIHFRPRKNYNLTSCTRTLMARFHKFTFITLPKVLRSAYLYVCLFACLSLSDHFHISKTARPSFTNFLYMLYTCGCGSIVHWRQCYMYFRFCGWRHVYIQCGE